MTTTSAADEWLLNDIRLVARPVTREEAASANHACDVDVRGCTLRVVLDDLSVEREHIESCRCEALARGNTRSAELTERLLALTDAQLREWMAAVTGTRYRLLSAERG